MKAPTAREINTILKRCKGGKHAKRKGKGVKRALLKAQQLQAQKASEEY